MTTPNFLALVSAAATALRDRKEEVNKLNVFPVPDGDTGTNMSLTMDTVVSELSSLPVSAPMEAVCHAITHGSLMGARGNSGVITSQILRGICEGIVDATEFTSLTVADALQRSVEVAFQAVRKPVEGTILTVLRDTSVAARRCADDGMELQPSLKVISSASFESVKNTPNLLPVLKENDVVDAGGFGLAIMIEAFVAAATGENLAVPDMTVFTPSGPKVAIEQVDDWEGSKYLYCTEFLFEATGIDKEKVHDFLASMGDSELLVGEEPQYKVHVHTNDPGKVLSYMTGLGQVADVHIHNMKLQAGERTAELAAEKTQKPRKPLGFVAVAAGEGMASILTSLGVDLVVAGGQTMNPATKDLLDAIEQVHADNVIVLPNNKNIILTANAAAKSVEDCNVFVVPTTSVPEAFAAMFVVNPDGDPADIAEEMEDAIGEVHTGEITHAIKDAKAANGDPIKSGDVIGIADHEIEVVGSKIPDVGIKLIEKLLADDGDNLTILAGKDLTDKELAAFVKKVEKKYPDLEIDTHRGEQPLYPLVMSVE